jgi:hypothetical protein
VAALATEVAKGMWNCENVHVFKGADGSTGAPETYFQGTLEVGDGTWRLRGIMYPGDRAEQAWDSKGTFRLAGGELAVTDPSGRFFGPDEGNLAGLPAQLSDPTSTTLHWQYAPDAGSTHRTLDVEAQYTAKSVTLTNKGYTVTCTR